MPSPPVLDGARVLVLGGSGVLGHAIAARLHKRGAQIVLAGRDRDRLQANATSLSAQTPSVLFDLSQPGHAEHVVATANDLLGGLDGIVNAAGVVAFGSLESLDDHVLDQLVATNLTGPLRVARAAIPLLRGGGFFVMISGVVAEQPVAGMTAYSAVKTGASAAARALGRELRRESIHVLDARPPHTETGLSTRAIAGSAPDFGGGLDPEAVADTIVDGLAAGTRELAAADFR